MYIASLYWHLNNLKGRSYDWGLENHVYLTKRQSRRPWNSWPYISYCFKVVHTYRKVLSNFSLVPPYSPASSTSLEFHPKFTLSSLASISCQISKLVGKSLALKTKLFEIQMLTSKGRYAEGGTWCILIRTQLMDPKKQQSVLMGGGVSGSSWSSWLCMKRSRRRWCQLSSAAAE